VHVDYTFVSEVRGPNGGVLFKYDAVQVQAFDSNTADVVNYALRRVVTDGTGFAAKALGRPAAGKTGTTNGNKSAWFAGYTPDLAAAVMLVKDGADGKPTTLSGVGGMSSVTGGSFPARIWTAFMRGALEGTEATPFVEPADLPTAEPTVSVTASPTATATPTPTTSSATPTPTTSSAPPTPTDSPTPTPTSDSPTPTATATATPAASAAGAAAGP